jgi:hypothetical protein
MIDSTIVRAHQRSSGAVRKDPDQTIGRSKGGLSTKIHATADALGNPTGFHLPGGQAFDLDFEVSQKRNWALAKPDGWRSQLPQLLASLCRRANWRLLGAKTLMAAVTTDRMVFALTSRKSALAPSSRHARDAW